MMNRKTKIVTLKDGIKIKRGAIACNINKNRKYSIIVDGKVIASNLLYCEVQKFLSIARR